MATHQVAIATEPRLKRVQALNRLPISPPDFAPHRLFVRPGNSVFSKK